MFRCQLLRVCLFVSGLLVIAPEHLAAQELRLDRAPAPDSPFALPADKWVELRFELSNPTENDEEVLLTTYFSDVPSQQFGRRLWIPAKSTRLGWILAKSPGLNSNQTTPLDLQTLVLREVDGVEQAAATDQGRRQFEHYNRFSASAPNRLLLCRANDDACIDMMHAMKIRGSDQFHILTSGEFPHSLQAYDGFSYVVLTDRRLVRSPESAAVLREWVDAGGSLWIHLERTGPGVLDYLLTSGDSLSVVERLDQTQFSITSIGAKGESGRHQVSLETPMGILRTIPQGGEVLSDVDGWPAVIEFNQGRGRILVTTVALEVLFHKPTIRERSTQLKPRTTSFGESVNLHFFDVATEDEKSTPNWSDLSRSYVGERIPGKGLIAAILCGFCALLIGSGVWALRHHQFLKVSLWATSLALVLAVGVSLLGMQYRRGIPPTRGAAQFVEVDEEGNVSIEGAETVLADRSQAQAVDIRESGNLEFADELMGAAKRIVLTDEGTKRWENVSWTVGTLTSDYRFHQVTAPSAATLVPGDGGFTGQILGAVPEQATEGLLVFPGGGKCYVSINRAGELQGQDGDVLRPGEYFKSSLLSDRQRTQSSIYEAYLANDDGVPDHPRLYFWDAPVALNTDEFPVDRNIGDALFSFPVAFRSPQQGTRVRLISPYVEYRAVGHPVWGQSTVFKNGKREWIESQSAESYSYLQCSIPKEFGSLDVQELTVAIDARIPNREVRLSAGTDSSNLKELAVWESPIGRKTVTISDKQLLSNDPEQIVYLLLHVGQLSGIEDDQVKEGNAAWRVEEIQIEGWAESQ
ncbi:MAG: hypothetical protein R3C18_23120 [Planctomycetaceae bacterium]